MEKEKKLYTTDEIAEMLNCTSSVVRNITSYYHIRSEKEVRDRSVRHALYSYDAVRLIKAYHERRKQKAKKKMVALFPERTEEEIAVLEDHTLVTDKRCLDLNWWPDVVPSCFVETEIM